MATLIEIDSGRHGYATVLDRVRWGGRKRSPRGMPTLDLGHTTIVLPTPYEALPIGVGRGVKKAIAAAEALQLIGGVSKAKLITAIEPWFRAFQEDDGRFHGAYGPRVGGQIARQISKLREDRDSRQAVIQVWQQARDNFTDPVPRDVPCTIALGLAIVDDRLDCHVTMRSNDAWLGLPYDLFQFTQLQLTAANVLRVEPGVYRHTAWSLHLYERDLENVERVVTPIDSFDPPLPTGIGGPDAVDWSGIEDTARLLLDGAASSSLLTRSELWYRDALQPFIEELP